MIELLMLSITILVASCKTTTNCYYPDETDVIVVSGFKCHKNCGKVENQ